MHTGLARTVTTLAALLLAAGGAVHAQWGFTEVADSAGVGFLHGFPGGFGSDMERMVGGVAAEDVDGDGWLDLYVLRGEAATDTLMRNMGDGTFAPFAIQPATTPWPRCGAAFADLDGDGWMDLLVGSLPGDFAPPDPALYRNTGGGTFETVTDAGGLAVGPPTPQQIFSTAFGDYDRDGDLDVALAHWSSQPGLTLRRNDGSMTLTDVTGAAGLLGPLIFGFTPNFADLDGDGWSDLLVAADFGTSAVYLNDQDGTFTRTNDPAITDENGMGAGVADYDGDGDLDWFVSSIWDPDGDAEGNNWGTSGNRLYRNQGDGSFDDVTIAAGVDEGWWGWGSCFADFNNDGLVDLFHTNGWSEAAATEFHDDPSRLFVAQPGGVFTEESAARGLVDTGQGRGVVCFDYDRDGDVDLLVANNSGPLRLYRNDGGTANHWLTVRLAGDPPNTAGVGARVQVTAGGATQVQEIRAGSNYVSSDPSEAHFGLGGATTVDELRVDWPLGGSRVLTGVAADRLLTISASAAPPPEVPATHTSGKLDASGDTLQLDWDTTTCGGATNHRVVWGYGSTLPGSAGGPLDVADAACLAGATGSFTWSPAPDGVADPSGLVWWVVVADDGALTEGGWGVGADGRPRHGAGPRGSSNLCGAMRRELSGECAP